MAAKTVDAYLKELPAERREVVAKLRAALRKSIPAGYEEGIASGMISWHIPLSRYPNTYNKQPLPYACLAARKDGYSLYLMTPYMDKRAASELAEAFRKAGKKLDMGKSCIRFRRLEDLALDAIGKAVARHSVEDFIRLYEKSRMIGA